MVSLVSLYFSSVNPLIPLLHRPTFEQCIGRRLHEDEPGFASTVLLVCALGSLYLPEVSRQERETLGWKWYNQVELCGHTLKNLPALYDLQAYCLAAEFLNLTSNPRFCWSIVGFGLRLVEDMGAHRLKSAARPISAEEELEKRAFWRVNICSGHLSAALGRSAVFDPPGFDMDLPSECDDEYWGISGPGAQPPGIPSSVSFFNSILNLYRIFHFTLRIFYCTTRSHTFMKIRHLWPIATQLGSTLDKWFSSIPQHLIWDPVHPDALFFDQSAALHCFHCYVRILIYRPFLPAVRPGLPTVSGFLRAHRTI
ncbi:fungal-specific transcription factor domain-containing protein [Mycena rosella]|uniref:Fungal-specific transcription factor domain-containing protein n=1 Tax=Mycena rosella TaxID=1033263 RepID=A0AAD7CVG8_MYCRO|nr:fungal-specific transcription factor domain-containing protein [Mycena rosella]